MTSVVRLLAVGSLGVACLFAQGVPPPSGIGPPGGSQQAKSAQATAPADFTGYFVSVVTEDWRWRMVTPIKGDFASIPLNNEGRRVGNAWDPDKDTADGNQCKAYGAVGLMQRPGRLHITWVDDNTLKVDADAGTQSRTWHFGTPPAPPGPPSLQGYSVAKWEGRAGIPGKPFVIWALGSSFTDRQGDGYELIQAIRRRFAGERPGRGAGGARGAGVVPGAGPAPAAALPEVLRVPQPTF